MIREYQEKIISNYFSTLTDSKFLSSFEFYSHDVFFNSASMDYFLRMDFDKFNIIIQPKTKLNDSEIDTFYIPTFSNVYFLSKIFENFKFNNVNMFIDKIKPILFNHNIFNETSIGNIERWHIYSLIEDSYNKNFKYSKIFKELTYNKNFLNCNKKKTNIKIKISFKFSDDKIKPFAVIDIPFIDRNKSTFIIPLYKDLNDDALNKAADKFRADSIKFIAQKISPYLDKDVNELIDLNEDSFKANINIANIMSV